MNLWHDVAPHRVRPEEVDSLLERQLALALAADPEALVRAARSAPR